jgi:hypothetical protein
MNISGKTKIWRKEMNGNNYYSTTISNKDMNGNWVNTYIPVQLPKDRELNNGTDIEIVKGFLSIYGQDKKIKAVVQEYQIINENTPQNDFISQDDKLPF